MKYLIWFTLFSVISFSQALAMQMEIFHPKTDRYLSFEEFIMELPKEGHIALGEFHNQTAIQNTQAQIINEKIQREGLFADFTIHWEFLNHTEQEKTDRIFFDFVANLITAEQFVEKTAGSRNLEYAPLVQVAKDLHGDFRGINLPRKYKQQVIAGGIRSIDPVLVPDSHYVGGDRYFERFKKVMGAHVPASKITAYFLAQCLTDSVMASQVAKYNGKRLNFIIAGSFHTDFQDATVERLEKLLGSDVLTLKFASHSLNSEEEIKQYKSYDPLYGFFADYIIVTE